MIQYDVVKLTALKLDQKKNAHKRADIMIGMIYAGSTKLVLSIYLSYVQLNASMLLKTRDVSTLIGMMTVR